MGLKILLSVACVKILLQGSSAVATDRQSRGQPVPSLLKAARRRLQDDSLPSSEAIGGHSVQTQRPLNNDLAVQVAGARLSTNREHAPYSAFVCTGLQYQEYSGGRTHADSPSYGCPYCRTCAFSGMCLNHSSLEWQYYRGAGNSAPLYYDEQGQPWHNFPGDFVSTGHVHIQPSHMDFGPRIMDSNIPQDAVFSSAPVAAYASLNDFVGNFGHALYDFLFPVFNVLQLLNLYHPDFQLLLAKHQGSNPGVAGAFIAPSNPERSLTALISKRPAMTLEQLVQETMASHPQAPLTCFREVVAGSGSLQATMQRTRSLPFRSAALLNLGMASEQSLGDGPPRITIVRKQGRRMLENTDEVAHHLQSRFSGQAVVKVLDANENVTIKEQLAIMSATSILLTPCGGIGTVSTFMQPGATAIVLNYWHSVWNTSRQMEANYYWNLEYLDFQYFPVLPEDYEGTRDRPACEKGPTDPHFETQGALIACNVRLKSLQRLDHIVFNALRRWQAHHHAGANVSQGVSSESSAHSGVSTEELVTKQGTEGLQLPVYVLSLPSATRRRAQITGQLQNVSAHFTLVEAINAKESITGERMQGAWHVDGHPLLPAHRKSAEPAASGLGSSSDDDASLQDKAMPIIYKLTIPDKCKSTAPAHLGCSFAHILTILSAYRAGQETVLVLEDDMQILRWPTQATLDSAPPDWQVLQLYMLGPKAEALYKDPPSLWVPWRPGLFNTGAYIINRAGMRRVIETYIPEVLSEQSTESNRTLITKWDAETILGSECVADYVMYKPPVSYSSTDFYFVEEALDSNIIAEHLSVHQSTSRLVVQLIQERGFQQDLKQ